MCQAWLIWITYRTRPCRLTLRTMANSVRMLRHSLSRDTPTCPLNSAYPLCLNSHRSLAMWMWPPSDSNIVIEWQSRIREPKTKIKDIASKRSMELLDTILLDRCDLWFDWTSDPDPSKRGPWFRASTLSFLWVASAALLTDFCDPLIAELQPQCAESSWP